MNSPHAITPNLLTGLLCFILLVPLVLANVSTDKERYLLDEIVFITADTSQMEHAELRIITETKTFQLNGAVGPVTEFKPILLGIHEVIIQDLLNPENKQHTTFTVMNETITKDVDIELPTPNSTQENNTVEDVELRNETNTAVNTTQLPGVITLSTKEFVLGENVSIDYSQGSINNSMLYIITPQELLRYLGNIIFPISFEPKEPGTYRVQLKTFTGEMIRSETFTVLPSEIPSPKVKVPPQQNVTEQAVIVTPTLPESLVRSPKNEPAPSINLALLAELVEEHGLLVVLDAKGRVLNVTAQKAKAKGFFAATKRVLGIKENRTLVLGSITDADINFTDGPIEVMQLNDLEIENGTRIGVDEVPKENVVIEKDIRKAFAIDLSDANFTDGIVTAVATGNELYKCAEWNFTEQQCMGSWVKVKDIIPGQEYSFEVYPGDPGYAETGLATVNTKKSLYHPGELAEILMVVLDTSGYLVADANISLTITPPNSIAFTYTNEIQETSKGVYEISFNQTSEVGNYSLIVTASAPGVDSTMFSSFSVQEFYAFDILRSTPATIDPWKGPFDSSIQLISYTNATTFNFSEVLPINFSVTNTGGAAQTTTNKKRILTWNGLTNNSVIQYSAQAPLVTPDLYELGQAYVTYNNEIFLESRIWYLAIDPIGASGDGLVVYAPVIGTTLYWRYIALNGTMSATENTFASGLASNIAMIRTVASPTNSSEVLMVVTDDANPSQANFFSFNNATQTWSASTTLTTAGSTDVGGNKPVLYADVAYEQNSGEAIILYGDNLGNVYYRTWNGTLSTQQTYSTNGNVHWLTLSSDPTSNNIMLVYEGGTPTVYANIWNGTAWGTEQNFGTSLNGATAKETGVADGAWEGTSGDGLASWIDNTGTIKYATYTGSTNTWGTATTITGLTTATNKGGSLRIIGSAINDSPNDVTGHDRIALLVVDGNIKNGKAELWNGTAWSGTWTQVGTVNNGLEAKGYLYDMEWVTNSTIDSLQIIFSEKTNTGLWSKTWDTSAGWSADTQLTGGASVNKVPLDLAKHYTSSRMLVSTVDKNQPGSFLWSNNGSSWGSAQTLNTGTPTGKYLESSVVFLNGRVDVIAPVITGISNAPNVIDVGGLVTIRANVTDNNGQGNINQVLVEILGTNYTMGYVSADLYTYTYTAAVLGDTNYTVFASDKANNNAISQTGNFSVVVFPNITSLSNPPNGSLLTNPVIDFNFTYVYGGTIDNCTLYTDFTGSWVANKTVISPANNTETNITVTAPEGNYIWNVLCVDNPFDWFDTNYSFSVDTNPPVTTLISPSSGSQDSDGNVTLTCSATDATDLVNLSLYTNVSGTWGLNQTVNYTGITDTSVSNGFVLNNVPENTSFIWNCLSTDIANRTDFATTNYSLSINYSADEAPVVTLNTPLNDTTTNNTFASFNCSATDDVGISTLTLYSNRTGSWGIENIISGGTGTLYLDMDYTLSDIPDNTYVKWNCKATDTNIADDWFSSNYTILFDPSEPVVTLNTPLNNNYTFVNNISVNCSATDDRDLVNLSVYTDATGTWQISDTVSFPGTTDTNVSVLFNLTALSYDFLFHWSCQATDNDTITTLASENRSITIVSQAVPFYSLNAYTDPALNDDWGTPPAVTVVTGVPDQSYLKNEKLDKNKWVVAANFSDVPTAGELFGVFFEMPWFVTARTDDELRVHYSTDNGTTWLDIDGTAESTASVVTNYPTTYANSTEEITGTLVWAQLPTLYLRIWGQKIGGKDNAPTNIDAVYMKLRYALPPIYSNIVKNDSIIFENDSVQFNTSWYHSVSLDCFIFSINQTGTFVNSSCINLVDRNDTASINQMITASAGTVVQWYIWANDTFGYTNQTPMQYFTVADSNDNVSPVINSITVTPAQNLSGSIFNLTANITDNIGVTTATAEITSTNGSKINYSMSQVNGGVFWEYLYTSVVGGNHSVKVYASDGVNTNVSTNPASFNVTAYVQVEKPFYSLSDTVRIVGYGFSASSPVTLTIFNTTGGATYGPVNVSANAQGIVNTTWTVPTPLTTSLGVYSASLNDTTVTWLSGVDNFTVLLRVDTALQLDKIFKTEADVTAKVLDSDALETIITGDKKNKDAYLSVNFLDNIQPGYTIDGVKIYVEHRDYNPTSLNTVVEYYDGAGWITATCSPMTFSSVTVVSVCDLTANMVSFPSQDNITIRLNYLNPNDDTNKDIEIDTINFTGLWVNYTISNVLAVSIDVPANTINKVNFTGEPGNNNHDAYSGETASRNTPFPGVPPPLTGTEASTAAYTALTSSDDSRWQSTALTNQQYAYQTFYFTVSQAVSDILGLTFQYEGYATKETSFKADKFRVFAYDFTNNAYTIISANPIDNKISTDTVYNLVLPAPYSDYINSSNGLVNILVVGDGKVDTANPIKSRTDIFTDFVDLTVETITTISGLQNINATAVDGDGISACQYRFTNSSGTNFTLYGMTNITEFTFHNISNTTIYTDGVYNITVNCSDTTTETASDFVTVKVVNTAPLLELVAPANDSNHTVTNNVSFAWNASSPLSGNPICDLYTDGTVNLSSVISLNGQITNKTVNNFSDGVHNWSVSCSMEGATNTSETRLFNVDRNPPTIALNSPVASSYESTATVNFTFTPTDVFTISSCELVVDGSISNTTTSVTNGAANTLTGAGLTQGTHNWGVNCTDTHSFEGNSTTISFYVDLENPQISLSNPTIGQIIVGGNVQFNYTATDSLSPTLTCDIVVNSFVEDNDYVATNGTPVIRNKNLGDGFKEWNVTCTDLSGRTNTSALWNFTIEGDPTVNLVSPVANASSNIFTIPFVYYVQDSNGIENCSLYLDGVINKTNYTTNITEGANNNFSVVLNTEKTYNWTVGCFDTTGRSTTPPVRLFTIDRVNPLITLLVPVNGENFTLGNVEFNFTVTDNFDTALTCNLSMTGGVSSSNINFNANNGSVTTINETGISSGNKDWNITCVDDAGNSNTSVTWNFFVGGVPDVTLQSPVNNGYSQENVTFDYIVTDPQGVDNCSLYINDTLNQTNTSINASTNNYFYLNNLPEQTLTWFVNCTNSVGNKAGASPFTLTIDNTKPTVQLFYPDGQIISNSTIIYNFTTTDNNDTSLLCNLSIDGVVNQTGITATSGTPKTVQVDGHSTATHNWTVACVDDAGNTNTSATNTFTVSFGPVVTLSTPENDTVDLDGNITFEYTLDNNSKVINSCSLLINDSVNQTINGTNISKQDGTCCNNFTLSNQPEQIFNWTVQCTDATLLNGTDTARVLHIDFVPPNITLNAPVNNSDISLSNITFNFTAFDNLDDVLSCNLSVYNGGSLNKSSNGIAATANVPTTELLTGFTSGNYSWNVSCTDGGFTNVSQTFNFTVSKIPSVELVLPENFSTVNSSTINFTYIPSSIAVGPPTGFQFCQLYIDDQLAGTNLFIENGVENGLINTSVSEGSHTWYVYCLDQDSFEKNSTTRNVTVDLTNPTATANAPDGLTLNSTVEFNWTATDNLDTSLSCEIYVNGTLNFTAGSPSGTPTLNNVTNFDDGYFVWNATCFDNANRSASTTTLNFTVAEAPIILLGNPADSNRTANINQTFFYTPNDNSGALGSCELVINGTSNTTNSTPVIIGSENNFTVNNFADGAYTWTVNCTDLSSYEGTNASIRDLFIDLTPPNITLTAPADAQTFSEDTITFNWTATDFVGTTITCDLYTDGSANITGLQEVSPGTFNATVSNMSAGSHNWSVTCVDDLNNTNSSATRTLTINEPDMQTNNSLVGALSANPDLGENITVYANVTNIGGSVATSVLVEFWDGLVGGGTFLGNDTATLAVNESRLFNTTWLITAGYHTINIAIDPNNTISEQNETNNNATFNISVLSANITNPANETTFSSNPVSIDFLLLDYTNRSMNYTLFVNDVTNETGNTTDNLSAQVNVTFPDGTHTLIIETTDDLARKKNSTEITITVDTNAPIVSFNTPNATYFNTTNTTVNFTATDIISTNITYRFFVDTVLNLTGNATNGTPTIETILNVQEGEHQLIIESTDELGNAGNSSVLTFYVDLTSPNPFIETANNMWFNTTTPSIDFNITDNLDPILNFTFFADNVTNKQGTVTNATSSSTNLLALGEGLHTLILNGLDEALNTQNSTFINIYIDVTPPSITLNNPTSGELMTDQNTTFNFTTIDNLDTLLECTLDVSDEGQFAINATNGSNTLYNIPSTSPGLHTWNVSCTDNALNTNISETRNFTIPAPDFIITPGNITFSNSTPVEDQVVEVNATVFNIGNSTASNVIVAFYFGDPDNGGTHIFNYTITTFAVGENYTFSVNHTAVIGQNDIYVVVDPPFLTNGSISEENETNNKATNGFQVGFFNIFAGLTNNFLHIDDSTLISLFQWNQSNGTGSLVFVADVDSVLDFTAFQALGRNTTNDTAGDDFTDVDTAMGSTNLTDSVNLTWTQGGTPKLTNNYVMFSNGVDNVAIINSTNTTSFQTGILWDTSDGGAEYNGSQDVIFFSQINESKVGERGTYDYEVRVPALLDQLIPGTDAVAFYAEIK